MQPSATPATLRTASTRPNVLTAVAMRASTSSSLVTSQWTGNTSPPTSSAVVCSAPLMSAATTLAPSRMNTLTDALAMPEPAPVMTATLLSNSPIALLSFLGFPWVSVLMIGGSPLISGPDPARRAGSSPRYW